MRKKIYFWAIVFFLFDLISKILLSSFLHEEITVINDFFYLTLTNNTGGAFSLFSGYTYVLAIIGILVLVYLDRGFIKKDMSLLSSFSMSLLIGGVFGNLFDRIIHGYVIDFLRFKIFGYNFPVFNIAGICICIGVLLLIIDLIRGEKDGNKSR